MDVSDYIYVIIGVLWFLFSIIGGAAKAKKLKQNKPASEKTSIPGSGQTDEVRKMLEDLLHGKQQKPKPVVEELRPVKKSTIRPKKEPAKLDVHKEHASFIDEKKKSKKSLADNRESLSSYTDSSFSTTSSLQHPPDQSPAEQVAEIVTQFKDVSVRKHPLMEDFDAQKAFIFSEIFSRRFH